MFVLVHCVNLQLLIHVVMIMSRMCTLSIQLQVLASKMLKQFSVTTWRVSGVCSERK